MRHRTSSYMVTGLAITIIATLVFCLFCIYLIRSERPRPEYVSVEVVMIFFWWLFPVLSMMVGYQLYYGKKVWRSLFSWTYIEEQGVRNVYRGGTDIFIPWDECRHITVCWISGRIVTYFVCLSKNSLSEKQLKNPLKVPISNDCIWIEFSDALYKELMCYIDVDEIINRDEAKIKHVHLIKDRVEHIKRKTSK